MIIFVNKQCLITPVSTVWGMYNDRWHGFNLSINHLLICAISLPSPLLSVKMVYFKPALTLTATQCSSVYMLANPSLDKMMTKDFIRVP